MWHWASEAPWNPRQLIGSWLAPTILRTPQIAQALGATRQPLTECSARHWQEAWRVGNDILRADGYPESYLYHPGQQVGWGSISDWMFVKCWEGGKLVKNHLEAGTFVGERIIIRQSRAEVSKNLAFLIDTVQLYRQSVEKKHLASKGRLLIVLAGWTEPILAERIAGHPVAWIVNPLPQRSP